VNSNYYVDLKKNLPLLIFHIAFWLYICSQQNVADASIHSKNEKLAMSPYEIGHMSFIAKLEAHFWLQ
jgi:hypothetical protein